MSEGILLRVGGGGTGGVIDARRLVSQAHTSSTHQFPPIVDPQHRMISVSRSQPSTSVGQSAGSTESDATGDTRPARAGVGSPTPSQGTPSKYASQTAA